MSTRDPLVLQRYLAGLATLEANLRTVLHAVRAAYPEDHRRPPEDEPDEVVSAYLLAELGDDLLAALDDHRGHVAARLNRQQHPEQTAWPF